MTTTAAPVAEMLPIADIEVQTQSRKKFDEAALKELAENIKTYGVLNPVIVRSIDGQLILVAGERRLRAAKLAGLAEIPARIFEMNDQTALEVQASENLQRKDITPIEEAFAFKTLLGRYTAEELASKIGKSESYVYRTARLAELPTQVTDLIESGDLTPAHGYQLLRVPDENRGQAIEWATEKDYAGAYPTAKELRATIERSLGARLEDAPFSKSKEFAGKIACTACPSNSGNQGRLFDGAEKGTCANKPCFDKKTQTHWETVTAKLEKKHEATVFLSRGVWGSGHTMHGVVVGKQLSEEGAKIKKGDALIIDTNSNVVWIGTPVKKEAAPVPVKQQDPAIVAKAQAERTALVKAIVKAAKGKKLELADWQRLARVLSNEINSDYFEQITSWGEVDKVSEAEAKTIVFLAARFGYDVDEDKAKKIGVDVKAVKKAVVLEAAV